MRLKKRLSFFIAIVLLIAALFLAAIVGYDPTDPQKYHARRQLQELQALERRLARLAHLERRKQALDRGLTEAKKGDYDEAIADYSEAIRLDPDYALAYWSRGMCYLFKDDYDQAILELYGRDRARIPLPPHIHQPCGVL